MRNLLAALVVSVLGLFSSVASAQECVPSEGWTCDPAWQGDNYCDCGCGVFDEEDCASQTDPSFNTCQGYSRCVPEALDPTNNGICLEDVWTCNVNYYNDGYCDCGCGVADPDCTTGEVSECFECGGCTMVAGQTSGNCSLLDPENTALCVMCE